MEEKSQLLLTRGVQISRLLEKSTDPTPGAYLSRKFKGFRTTLVEAEEKAAGDSCPFLGFEKTREVKEEIRLWV